MKDTEYQRYRELYKFINVIAIASMLNSVAIVLHIIKSLF